MLSDKTEREVITLENVASVIGIPSGDYDWIRVLLQVGSVAEGLGTVTSDLDFILIVESGPEWVRHGQFRIGKLGQKRVEVAIYSVEGAHRMLSVCRQDSFNDQSLRSLELLHKLLTGVCLVGQEYFRSLINPAVNFDVKMSEFYLKAGENIYEDILGLVEANDYLTAVVQTRELVRFAFDSLLASNGDTYPKAKWRPRRLSNLLPSDSLYLQRFLENEFRAPHQLENSQIMCWIHEQLRLVQRIALTVYFPWIALDWAPAQGSFSSNPWSYIYRYCGKYFVRLRDATFSVNSEGALIALLACASPDEESIFLALESGGLCAAQEKSKYLLQIRTLNRNLINQRIILDETAFIIGENRNAAAADL